MEILRSIPTDGISRPYAYAVWFGRDGEIQMGPVRFRRAVGETFEYECSPFPGAWDWHVPESAMIRVRHLGAMSLGNMQCVCRGTEFDRGCPARNCKTVEC